MEGRKNKMVKAVFFDIDGTLLDHGRGGVMPDSTKRSLHALRDKGVKLFVATGRFPAMVTFMEAMFPFDGYVTMNGQLVVLADGSVIHRLGHHPEDIRRLDAVSRQKGFPSLIIEEDAYFYTVPSPEIDRHFISGHLPPPGRTYDPARLAEHPVLQFLIYSPEDLPALDALEHIAITSAGGSIFDIIPKTGGKQVGIGAAAEYFHIQQEEVMVFGDGDNDAQMLRWAGTGVAMGNGTESAKSAARYITSPVDQDGIEKALRHFRVL